MIALNNLVNKLFDGSIGIAANVGRGIGNYTSNFGRYTSNIGEIVGYVRNNPMESLGYVARNGLKSGLLATLLFISCKIGDATPMQSTRYPTPTNTPYPTATLTEVPLRSTTYMFYENNGSCGLKVDQSSIKPEKQNTPYDTRLVMIEDATTDNRGVGFLISNRLILTAAHVVDNPNRRLLIYSPSNQTPLKATVVAQDERQDLALIKLLDETIENRDYVRFRSDVVVDEKVRIKTINTIDEKYENPSSQINIPGKYDSSDAFPEGWKRRSDDRFPRFKDRYTLDFQSTPGTSGSPLVDEQNIVIGNHNGGLILVDKRTRSVLYLGTFDILEQTEKTKEQFPDAVFMSLSPEPRAIVDFLQNYCSEVYSNSERETSFHQE